MIVVSFVHWLNEEAFTVLIKSSSTLVRLLQPVKTDSPSKLQRSNLIEESEVQPLKAPSPIVVHAGRIMF